MLHLLLLLSRILKASESLLGIGHERDTERYKGAVTSLKLEEEKGKENRLRSRDRIAADIKPLFCFLLERRRRGKINKNQTNIER